MERYDINSIPKANTAEAGALRVANSVDEKNCGCVDAAITPSNLYNLLGCRKANTSYTVGEIVTCPYYPEFLLKCTVAGSTAAGSLDTTSATLGKVYTDGGVKWEVINPLNDYLLLSGGKMTGAIKTNGILALGGTGIDRKEAYLRLVGSADGSQAASLWLGDNLHSTLKGGFSLQTGRDENDINYRLEGLINGKLVWNGLELAQKTKLSMPSDNYIDIDTSVTSYTAPSDGWLTAICQTNTDYVNWINLENQTNGLCVNNIVKHNEAKIACAIPCAKGDTVKLDTVAGRGTITMLRFVYAQSEV